MLNQLSNLISVALFILELSKSLMPNKKFEYIRIRLVEVQKELMKEP
jgi:hypothetical protein